MLSGRPAEAVDALKRLVQEPDLPFTGWTIPIEPLLPPTKKPRISVGSRHPRRQSTLNSEFFTFPSRLLSSGAATVVTHMVDSPWKGEMMNRLAIAVLISCVLVGARTVDAQGAAPAGDAPASLYELVLRDGSRLIGRIADQDLTEVVFVTVAGVTITAPRPEIESLREVTGRVTEGQFLPEDPNVTRLFFWPTGRSLRKGQTYLGVYEFLMPFVQVGVSDRFSIGGGTPLMFGLDGDEWDRPFWITPKLQVLNRARTQLSIGTFHVFDTNGNNGGVGYVVGTHGDPAHRHGGWRHRLRNWRRPIGDIVMVGGERQVRRNLMLITENYVGRAATGLASAVVRFFGDRSRRRVIGIPMESIRRLLPG